MRITLEFLDKSRLREAVGVIESAFGKTYKHAATHDLELSLSNAPLKPTTLLAIFNEEVIGTIQYMPAFFSFNTYAFLWVSIAKHKQGQGFSRELMSLFENHIAENILAGNPGTIICSSSKNLPADFYPKIMGATQGPTQHDGSVIITKNLNPS